MEGRTSVSSCARLSSSRSGVDIIQCCWATRQSKTANSRSPKAWILAAVRCISTGQLQTSRLTSDGMPLAQWSAADRRSRHEEQWTTVDVEAEALETMEAISQTTHRPAATSKHCMPATTTTAPTMRHVEGHGGLGAGRRSLLPQDSALHIRL